MATEERPIRVLSLGTYFMLVIDGGGVRGLSSLIILKQIMKGINDKRAPAGLPPLEPCQVFDLIGGTSTGGIIAIMLGRLRMSLEDCEKAYLKLSREIFTPKRPGLHFFGQTADFLQGIGKFDAKVLERAIKDCIASVAGQDDSLKDEEDLLRDPESACKVFVVTALQDHTKPVLLRSYKTVIRPGETTIEVVYDECKIWQACRATSAATTFFDPIEIGMYKNKFIDGGVLYNNPVQQVFLEAKNLWRDQEVLILSIGTGGAPGGRFGGNLKSIIDGMRRIVTETEQTAQMFYRSHSDLVQDGRYFRFNVNDMSKIGLQEHEEIPNIQADTMAYLDDVETGTKLATCTDRLFGSTSKDPATFRQPGVRQVKTPTTLPEERRFYRFIHKSRTGTGNQSMPNLTNSSQQAQNSSMSLAVNAYQETGLSLSFTDLSVQPNSTSESYISSETAISEPSISILERPTPQILNTRFIDAARSGRTDILLEYLANPVSNSQLEQVSINIAVVELSRRPEHEMQRQEALALVNLRHPDLEYTDPEYSKQLLTPLMWAASFGYDRVIGILLSKGANPAALDEKFGRTPLIWAAARKDNLKAVKLLLESLSQSHPEMINKEDVDGKTALAFAYSQNQILTATTLVKHGADPNIDIGGAPLLVKAIQWRDESFVRLLVEKGANVSDLDVNRFRDLSVAIRARPRALIQFLVAKGANI